MGRFRVAAGFLVLLTCGGPAWAETCSSSTLASAEFAVARWCGDPPAAGRLRLVRRGGRAEEFLDVPLDRYREVVRVPNVGRYVAEEVVPHFERVAVVPEAGERARAGRAAGGADGTGGHARASLMGRER